MKKKFLFFLTLLTSFPHLMFALDLSQGTNDICPDGATLCTILNKAGDIATLIIILLMIVATVVFIYGVIKYILAGGSEQRKKEAQGMIIWGLIGLFILVAVWGLVAILENTFGIEREDIPQLPGQIGF